MDTPSKHSASIRRANGFTLIELLVVIVIIAITVSVFILAWTPNTPDDALKEQSLKLKNLLEFSQDQAVIRGEEYGVRFYSDGYRFMKMDVDKNKWVWQDDPLLNEKPLPENMQLELSLEDVDTNLIRLDQEKMASLTQDQDQEKEQPEDATKVIKPQVFVLSSDEITPSFEVRFRIRGINPYYQIRAHINGQYEITRQE